MAGSPGGKRDRKGHRVSTDRLFIRQSITNAAGRLRYRIRAVVCCLPDGGPLFYTTGIIPRIDAFFCGLVDRKQARCVLNGWNAGIGSPAPVQPGSPLTLMKHYLFNSCYYALLLIVSVWAFFKMEETHDPGS